MFITELYYETDLTIIKVIIITQRLLDLIKTSPKGFLNATTQSWKALREKTLGVEKLKMQQGSQLYTDSKLML